MSAPSLKTCLDRVNGEIVVVIVASTDSADAYVALTPSQAEAVARSLLDLAQRARRAEAS